MDKKTKNAPKKTLVRNTVRPLPKVVFVDEEAKAKSSTVSEKPKVVSKPKPVGVKSNFSVPEINSTLALTKRAERIKEARTKKTASAPNLTTDEQVTRKLNVPPDEVLYKDLVPLCISKKPHVPLRARNPLPKKDVEPVLSDYATAAIGREYQFLPRVKFEDIKWKEEPSINETDNLRLYRILQRHENTDDSFRK